jgi:L-lactate dehydrogenase
MKVAVIGDGNVGRAVFRELQNVSGVNEIVLVGRKPDRLKAEVDDYLDAVVLRGYDTPRLSYGGYEATEGADILVYCAGSGKVEADRMEVLEGNCRIADSIFQQVNKYNRDGIILCLTNPVDVITMQVARTTGRDRSKVLGTGTLLDSARLTRFISDMLEISPRNTDMFVVGEHGNSSVALISSFRVAGMTLDEYLSSETGFAGHVNSSQLNETIRNAAFRIIKGKGFTNYGVAAAACVLVHAIASDARAVYPATVLLQGEYGLEGVAASVPAVIGAGGVEAIKRVKMTKEEEAGFYASVDIIREAASSVGL